MDDLIEQYGWVVIEIIAGMISLGLIFSTFSNQSFIEYIGMSNIEQSTLSSQVEYEIPVVREYDFIVENGIIEQYSAFDWRDYVCVQESCLDLTNYISVEGYVNTNECGQYRLSYYLRYNGVTIEKQATYYVKGDFS